MNLQNNNNGMRVHPVRSSRGRGRGKAYNVNRTRGPETATGNGPVGARRSTPVFFRRKSVSTTGNRPKGDTERCPRRTKRKDHLPVNQPSTTTRRSVDHPEEGGSARGGGGGGGGWCWLGGGGGCLWGGGGGGGGGGWGGVRGFRVLREKGGRW